MDIMLKYDMDKSVTCEPRMVQNAGVGNYLWIKKGAIGAKWQGPEDHTDNWERAHLAMIPSPGEVSIRMNIIFNPMNHLKQLSRVRMICQPY